MASFTIFFNLLIIRDMFHKFNLKIFKNKRLNRHEKNKTRRPNDRKISLFLSLPQQCREKEIGTGRLNR